MNRYGTNPKLDKLADSDNWEDRARVAEQGYALDKLINDEDYRVRRVVAEKGYGLDKLVNDTAYEVRAAVARQGYGLDKLVNDKYCSIRIVVAKQGYGLDILIIDTDEYVRRAAYKYLTEHKYNSIFEWTKDNKIDIDINEWLHSSIWFKRREVAKFGYRLDILINDSDMLIREIAMDYLKNHNYLSIFDWAKDNNVNLDINEWLHSNEYIKRLEVVKAGYRLDVLINDRDMFIYNAVIEYLENHDYLSIADWAKDNDIDIPY